MIKYSYKIIPAIFILIFIAAYANAAQEFVGSKASKKYHYPTCKWVKEIKPHELIKFDSPETAQKTAYISCPTCKPPLPKADKTTNDAISKDIDKQNSKQVQNKRFHFNIVFGFLLLLFLLFIPFLPGLIEMVIDRDSSSEITGKKDPTQ